MSAAHDPVGTSSPIDVDKLAAAYSSKISYLDVLNVEARYQIKNSPYPGSSDPLCQTGAMVSDWHDLTHEELLFAKKAYLPNLVDIEAKLKGLLSQSPESADKYEPLKIFLEEYMKFLALSKADFLRVSKNKCYMLMTLIKSFIAQFDDSLSSYEYGKQLISLGDLSQIPELQQRMVIKVLSTNPSLRSESAFIDSACQSEWVRLDDWHDRAHRELKAIRRVYLPQLLKAYERVCGLWSENPELSTKYLASKIFLLEYCKFLTIPRSNFLGLSRGECYVLMMLIKNQLWHQLLPTRSQSPIAEILDELDLRVEFVDPSSACESASSDPVHLVQAEWDALAHQELRSLRNMHSSQLDKTFKMVYDLKCQSPLPKNKYESTAAATARALNFLVMSRAEILALSKEVFYDNMRLFKAIVKHPVISYDHCDQVQQFQTSNSDDPMKNQGNPSLRCEASMDAACLIQSERFTNLNDKLYEELQLMKKKYMPVLLRAYRKLNNNQNPGKYHGVATESIIRCLNFLEKTRHSMAFRSRDGHEAWVEFTKIVVDRCKIYLSRVDCRSTMKQPGFGYREVEPDPYDNID